MKPRPSALLRLVLLLVVLGWGGSAGAQTSTTEAQRLFTRAERAFESGQFDEAAKLFEAADSAAPHASVIYNAGISWERAGLLPQAADAYMEALSRGGLDEDKVQSSEARLEILTRQLGFVQIAKPVGSSVSVGHKQRVPIPTRFFLNPGEYRLLLETDTSASSETPIRVQPGETLRLELSVPLAAPTAETPGMPPPPPPPDGERSRGASDSTQRVLGWVGIAIGVAATGTAIYLGTQALEQKSRWEDESRTPRSRLEARGKAEDLMLGTNVAWGGAALFGGTGLVLLLTAPVVEF